MAVVRNEATIQFGIDLYEFLSKNFTKPASDKAELNSRIFFYVPPNEIVRKGRQFSDVPGNRKIHCVKLDGENSHLLTNTRSCYCPGCRYGELDKCCNKDFLDDWQTVNIEMLSLPSDKVTRSEPSPEATRVEGIAELVTEGSVVAVAAEGDPNYDHYLFQVTSQQPELLAKNEQDEYGAVVPKGCKVLTGHFFVRENLLDMTYRLEDKKTAIVHIRTIRCICFELKRKKARNDKAIYKVSLEQHEEIMENL